MGKQYFNDYVDHMLRLWVSGKPARSTADEANVAAVENVMEEVSDYDRRIIENIFRADPTIRFGVEETAMEFSVDENVVWLILSKVSRRIAEERGLI